MTTHTPPLPPRVTVALDAHNVSWPRIIGVNPWMPEEWDNEVWPFPEGEYLSIQEHEHLMREREAELEFRIQMLLDDPECELYRKQALEAIKPAREKGKAMPEEGE